MGRKMLIKKIGAVPTFEKFLPVMKEGDINEKCKERAKLFLKIEEWETLRLIDYLGIERMKAAEAMGISRQTLNILLKTARTKVARAVVEGIGLYLEYSDNIDFTSHISLFKGRKKKMRVAVTHEKGQIFGHFGRTKEFVLFDIENGKIINSKIENAPAEGHGAIVEFLREMKASVLICGGIGPGALNNLSEAGITIYAGASGSVEEQIDAFINGKLSENKEANCNHHHEGGHSCHS